MENTQYANSIIRAMLGWLKGFASWILKLFNLAGTHGFSPLKWLSDNWMQLLILLVIVGVFMDFLIWMIRWRPYWVWFRKKRVVVDDEDFFVGEDLLHAGMYDKKIFGTNLSTPEKKPEHTKKPEYTKNTPVKVNDI